MKNIKVERVQYSIPTNVRKAHYRRAEGAAAAAAATATTQHFFININQAARETI
jgi:hypothetical protein